MKKSNFIFESILIIITLTLGICTIAQVDFGFLFLFWLQPLGVLQVLHSIEIGIFYWGQKTIRTTIVVYWSCVLLEFILMYTNMHYFHDRILLWFTLPVFPLLLAVYLFGITYYFKDRGVKTINLTTA